MKKIILALGLLGLLTGCAAPARVGAMTVESAPATLVSATSPLKNSVAMGTVTGGQKTDPLWTSEVGNPEFTEALRNSLDVNTMLSKTPNRYRLDAKLIKVKQPFAGFDMTVTTTVQYTLTETGSNKTAFDKTIVSEFTAGVGDAFVAVKRLRLANEGSIKKNITMFLEQLVASFKTPGNAPTPPGKPVS